MTDEGHRREDGATGVPGDQAGAQKVADATVDEFAVREAEAEDDDAAVRETGAADGETTSRESGVAGDEAADHEAGTDGAPPGSERSEAPAASLEDELTEARHAAQENLDRAVRAQAELENVRRRVARDIEHAHKFGLERFVSELLPVKDSLELGLAAAAEEGASAARIAEGVELTLRMLEQAMDKFGIRSIDPVDEPFDPEFHQAMTMQESDTAESGAVLAVIQKGYLLNERLVRPAMVIVAK